MPLIVTVNTIAECLRTDCNIMGDKIKKRGNAFLAAPPPPHYEYVNNGLFGASSFKF